MKQFITRRSFIKAAGAATALTAVSVGAPAAFAEETNCFFGDKADVTILYTNDVHTYIDNKSPKPTYAAIAALKKSIEDTGRDVLLVDAGDHIQGTAYGSMDDGATIIELMNEAGYDLATPGNHEFDYGMARAKAIIKEADFPYVSCKDVRDYIYGQMYKILSSANIEYVKWDMNRQLCEVGNEVLPPERQREIWHRYVLGVYEIQERLLTDFPDLLLENCAGGGSRFDAGMLYYSPQIWCSDDTDAIERLKIQYGTSMCYPCSCFGAHVSDSPNHCAGRITPFETRGRVAMVGTFGYELDITKISDDDKWNIRKQIEEFNKYNPLVRTGDHYRIGNPFDNDRFDAWEFVAKDKSEALLEYVQVLKEPSVFLHRVRLAGLEKGCYYRHEETGKVYSAEVLMNSGFDIPSLWGDFQSYIAHFIKEN